MEYRKLNELCEINIGKTPSRNKSEYWGEGSSWLSISDLKDKFITKTKEEITSKAISECNMKIVPKNTVVMSFKLSIGKTAILKEDMYTNEAIANFPIKNDSLISEYLYYAIKTLNFDNTDRAVMGATLNKAKLNELKIPYCEINKQKEIVEVLNKAQELINKRKEQIAALDELVKSKFIEMFGVPLVNTKGWNEMVAGEVCFKITDGSHFSPKDCPNSTIPMLSVKDMMANRFSYDTCKHVAKEDYEELKKNGCKPLLDDVLIAKDGSYFYYGFVLEKEIEQAVLSSIAILRPNKEIVNPHYLRNYMMSKEIVDLVGNKYVSGAALKRVILKGIRQIPVMVPPIELQNEFELFVKQIDKLKFEMEKSLKELEDNFNSLMQKAFKGELFN